MRTPPPMSTETPTRPLTDGGGRQAHFVGVAGVGMTATAMLLAELGWRITGTDPGCHPPSSDHLAAAGIVVHDRYSADHLPPGCELVVAGASAKVDPEKNAEVGAAVERGLPVRTFPEVLGELTRSTHNLTVAGSFGKSTTTALVAWILDQGGLDPGYFIGAFPHQLERPARIGSGRQFVLEGDEYLTSGADRRSKFLHWRTDSLLLTSLEHDHVNLFPDQAAYEAPFAELAHRMEERGLIVGCADDPRIAGLLAGAPARVATYGLDPAGRPRWSAGGVELGPRGARFRLLRDGEEVCRLESSLLGRHNVQNAVGAAALVLERELVAPRVVVEAVAAFEGLERRLDRISGPDSALLVYEGFGSSRAKARAAIDALRAHHPGRRLAVLFEPHAFSWRNRSTLSWYDDAFEAADAVVVYRPAQAGAERHDQLGHAEIVARLERHHPAVSAALSPREALDAVRSAVRAGDLLLVLTSGSLEGVVGRLPRWAAEHYPAGRRSKIR